MSEPTDPTDLLTNLDYLPESNDDPTDDDVPLKDRYSDLSVFYEVIVMTTPTMYDPHVITRDLDALLTSSFENMQIHNDADTT